MLLFLRREIDSHDRSIERLFLIYIQSMNINPPGSEQPGDQRELQTAAEQHTALVDPALLFTSSLERVARLS